MAAYHVEPDWQAWLDGAEAQFRAVITKAGPDALCADMFDAEILAQADLAKTAALTQRQDHLHVLRNRRESLRGQRSERTCCLQDLRQDLAELESALAAARELRQNYEKGGRGHG